MQFVAAYLCLGLVLLLPHGAQGRTLEEMQGLLDLSEKYDIKHFFKAQHIPGKGSGVVATRDIAEGEAMFTIPLAHTLRQLPNNPFTLNVDPTVSVFPDVLWVMVSDVPQLSPVVKRYVELFPAYEEYAGAPWMLKGEEEIMAEAAGLLALSSDLTQMAPRYLGEVFPAIQGTLKPEVNVCSMDTLPAWAEKIIASVPSCETRKCRCRSWMRYMIW